MSVETLPPQLSPALKLPPKAKGRWGLGNFLQYLRDPLGFGQSCAREYGDVVKLWLLPWRPSVALFHPQDIEAVLRHQAQKFRKDDGTRAISFVLGNGLVTNEGDSWRQQRRKIQPGFQRSEVERYADIIVGFTRRAVEKWQPGEIRDVHTDMMHLTLEIVGKALFDADVADQVQEVYDSLEEIMSFLTNIVNWIPARKYFPTPGYLRFQKAVKRIDEVMLRIIRRRKNQPPGGVDLLSQLLFPSDPQDAMTDQQLRDELLTLFLAGHETTALALSFCFRLIALHPKVENQVRDEIQGVLGDRDATAADYQRLTYTEMVLKESMRLYPPVWSIGREALEDVEIGGYRFPKGTTFEMWQWVVHRDARWYPEPDVFRPERWTKDEIESRPRCSYFPFGDGPRICIGLTFAMMEAVLVIATILQRVSLSVVGKAELAFAPSVTLRPAKGVPLKVEQR
ncbi:MAG: cytochrome P450 [Gemmataceae bacterium]